MSEQSSELVNEFFNISRSMIDDMLNRLTALEQKISKELVSKCVSLKEDLLKNIEEDKEEIQNLKNEIEKLLMSSGESENQLAQYMSLTEDFLQKIEEDREVIQNLKKEVEKLLMSSGESQNQLAQCMSLNEDLLKKIEEDREEINNMKKLIISTGDRESELAQIAEDQEEMRNLKKEIEKLIMSRGENQNQLAQCLTLDDMHAAFAMKRECVAKITGLEYSPMETQEFQLQRKDKNLHTRVEHLEGVQGHVLGQVKQLKTQLLDSAMADKMKVCDLGKSESSGLGEAMSEVPQCQRRDSVIGPKHPEQLHWETVELRNTLKALTEEVKNVKQELMELTLEQNKSQEEAMQEKAEGKKLPSIFDQMMKDHIEKQSHSENAEIYTVETKVHNHGRNIEELNTNFKIHEDIYHKITDEIYRELNSKFNCSELASLKKQVMLDCRKTILKELEPKTAAAVRRQLMTENAKYKCLFCDTPIKMSSHGPPMPSLPEFPQFFARLPPKRSRPCTNLGQCEGLLTRRRMSRECDRLCFSCHSYKEC